MSIQQIIARMQNIHNTLLYFIDNESDIEENFDNFLKICNDLQIGEDKHKLKSLLHLILILANDYKRTSTLYKKIDQILQHFSNEIKNFFSNSEIFDIFKKNKRILLFLLKEKILTVDSYFVNTITENKYLLAKYPRYFLPEIKQFLPNELMYMQKEEKSGIDSFYEGYDDSDVDEEKKWIENIPDEIPENFEENREKGENDSKICEIIRQDDISRFVQYITLTNTSLKSTFKNSTFETNSFLLKQYQISLIEYATFFGSNKIFQYLLTKKVNLTNSLWYYAIHGKSSQIINTLIENHIKPNERYDLYYYYGDEVNEEDVMFLDCLKESVKCHHNGIVDYFCANHFLDEKKSNSIRFSTSLEYLNFEFFICEDINESIFFDLCRYNYYSFVDVLLKTKDVDVNERIKYEQIFIFVFLK